MHVNLKVTLEELHAWSPKPGQRGHSCLLLLPLPSGQQQMGTFNGSKITAEGVGGALTGRGAQSDAAFPALELLFSVSSEHCEHCIPTSTSACFFHTTTFSPGLSSCSPSHIPQFYPAHPQVQAFILF